eukprot:982-Pelagomonas_calceolata.AAC.1
MTLGTALCIRAAWGVGVGMGIRRQGISCEHLPQPQEFLLLDIPSIHKMRSADLLDLSELVVDLRSLHLAYWRQFSGYDPRDTNSK